MRASLWKRWAQSPPQKTRFLPRPWAGSGRPQPGRLQIAGPQASSSLPAGWLVIGSAFLRAAAGCAFSFHFSSEVK
jgi:hypothetical protein